MLHKNFIISLLKHYLVFYGFVKPAQFKLFFYILIKNLINSF